MKWLDRIFKKISPDNKTRVELFSGLNTTFTPFNGDAYSSNIYRAAVDAIARNAAKLKASHVIVGDVTKTGNAQLDYMLQVRPNPFINAYDLIYKMVTHYYLYNNAIAYLERDAAGYLKGIWPMKPAQLELVNDAAGAVFCNATFQGGAKFTIPYDDLILLKRHFNSNDVTGDNNSAIYPTLDLANTQTQGIEAAINSSASIRGLLKFANVTSDADQQKAVQIFKNAFLTASNNGGIAAVDCKADYIPLDMKPYAIDDKQLITIKAEIFEYLGINEKIVNATYSENEWGAFYESVIEPLALQLSLEFTDKIFTPREKQFGNCIQFTANRLQFASNTTKAQIIKDLMPMGLFTVNQALEILNLPAVEGGDKRLQTLNVVNADGADKYQGVDNKQPDNTQPTDNTPPASEPAATDPPADQGAK